MTAQKIEGKIVGYKVANAQPAEAPSAEVVKFVREHMNESVSRPDVLLGSTYKVKTPQSEHAMYITLNDIVLNEGTDHEERRPYEIFINSKNMEQFQWVLALTRVISAVFRKGGDVEFLVDELKAVFDPKGGYFKKGGVFMPSLVAEIGDVIDKHLIRIGLKVVEVDQHQQAYLASKMVEATKAGFKVDENSVAFPPNATDCTKCHQKAMIIMDGCRTCLSCGESKCG